MHSSAPARPGLPPPPPQRHGTDRPVSPLETRQSPERLRAKRHNPKPRSAQRAQRRAEGRRGAAGPLGTKRGGKRKERGKAAVLLRPARLRGLPLPLPLPLSGPQSPQPPPPLRPRPGPPRPHPHVSAPRGFCPPQRRPTVLPTPSRRHPRLLTLTGRRGAISAEQQWQKKRPGCGEASAIFPPPPRRPAPPGDVRRRGRWPRRDKKRRRQKRTKWAVLRRRGVAF